MVRHIEMTIIDKAGMETEIIILGWMIRIGGMIDVIGIIRKEVTLPVQGILIEGITVQEIREKITTVITGMIAEQMGVEKNNMMQVGSRGMSHIESC